jgi:hypothetical protein
MSAEQARPGPTGVSGSRAPTWTDATVFGRGHSAAANPRANRLSAIRAKLKRPRSPTRHAPCGPHHPGVGCSRDGMPSNGIGRERGRRNGHALLRGKSLTHEWVERSPPFVLALLGSERFHTEVRCCDRGVAAQQRDVVDSACWDCMQRCSRPSQAMPALRRRRSGERGSASAQAGIGGSIALSLLSWLFL